MTRDVSRRDFIRTTTAAGLALGTPVFGLAQDHVYRTALIGSGWWGMNILRSALASGRIRAVALCDVDENQSGPAADEVEQLTGSRPRVFRDYRDLLEETEPEIVIVATPDHWHALPTIAALEAGAHVYVEKPVGHTIGEGQAMVAAARRHGRTVQVGTHRRVSPHNMSGIEFLRSGRAGKIGMVHAFVNYGRESAGRPEPDADPPAGLDWDFWCGPAPYRPFNSRIHPRGFRQYLDFANGTLGDWGIHWLDQVLWWTEEKYPKRVYSTGGRYFLEDGTDAPDCQVATFDFESFTLTWEHRLFAGNPEQNHNIGCYFYGSEGVFHMGWLDGWTFYPRGRNAEVVHQEPHLHEPDQQNIPELWADFVEAIEQQRQPVCDIEIGHRSTNLSLLGLISFRVGRSVEWDGAREQIVGDDEASALLRREYRSPWVYPG
jgi:predicted dehydrogenase